MALVMRKRPGKKLSRRSVTGWVERGVGKTGEPELVLELLGWAMVLCSYPLGRRSGRPSRRKLR